MRNNVTSATNRLIYGIDLAHGVARNDGGGGFFSSTSYAQTAFYAQDNMVLGRNSRAYAGVRGEQDGGAGGAITPSVGGTLGLGGGFALQANFGTAFRVPTAVVLHLPRFLQPVLATRTHAELRCDARQRARVRRREFRHWFVQTATNLITLNPLVDFSLPFGPENEPLVNQQQSSVAGFVLDVATLPFYGIVAKVNVTDTYRALAYIRRHARDAADRPGSRLRRTWTSAIPADPASTCWRRRVRPRARSGSPTSGGAGDYTSDRRIPAVSASRSTCSCPFRVNNLGNVAYQAITGYPAPGRTISVELSTR